VESPKAVSQSVPKEIPPIQIEEPWPWTVPLLTIPPLPKIAQPTPSNPEMAQPTPSKKLPKEIAQPLTPTTPPKPLPKEMALPPTAPKPIETKMSFSDKFAVIVIACHTDSMLKYKVLINNVHYLKELGYPILLVNTQGTEHYDYKLPNVEQTIFIPNNSVADFGKWAHAVDTFYLSQFEYVVFTNDSVIMTGTISSFFKTLGDIDLLAWNDSSEICHHYQSYFFAIHGTKLAPFRKYVALKAPLIRSHSDLVRMCELPLIDLYPKHDCYLRISNIPANQGYNINFNNDSLMYILLFSNKLPFIKVKRLKYNNFSKEIRTFLFQHVTPALASELRKIMI
jgi:hypothetical protein